MAAKVAIAMLRNDAMQRIETMLGEGFNLPRQGKDADLLFAQQLDAIATHLEQREASKAVAVMIENKPAKQPAAKAKR